MLLAVACSHSKQSSAVANWTTPLQTPSTAMTWKAFFLEQARLNNKQQTDVRIQTTECLNSPVRNVTEGVLFMRCVVDTSLTFEYLRDKLCLAGRKQPRGTNYKQILNVQKVFKGEIIPRKQMAAHHLFTSALLYFTGFLLPTENSCRNELSHGCSDIIFVSTFSPQ